MHNIVVGGIILDRLTYAEICEDMKKAREELMIAVETAKTNTKNALQTVYDALNQGQKKQIVKDETVKALFDLYGVEYE